MEKEVAETTKEQELQQEQAVAEEQVTPAQGDDAAAEPVEPEEPVELTDLDRARECLQAGKTLVLCKGETVYMSERQGIGQMLEYLEEKVDLRGFSAADKVIGRAAAMLFASAGVKEVWGDVVSRAALPVLEAYDISYRYGRLADRIINRRGDGLCPMEEAILAANTPREAYNILRERYRTLTGYSPRTQKQE